MGTIAVNSANTSARSIGSKDRIRAGDGRFRFESLFSN